MDKAYWRKFRFIASWSVAGQIISLLATFLLGFLIPEGFFGIFAFFLATATIFASFASLRIEWYIPNCQSEESILNHASAALRFTLLFSILALIFSPVLLLVEPMLPLQNIGILQLATISIAVGIFAVIENIATAILIQSNRVVKTAIPKTLKTVIFACLSLVLFILTPFNLILVLAYLASSAIYCILLLKALPHEELGPSAACKTFQLEFRPFLQKKYLLSTAISLTNTISLNLIPILLISFYGKKEAGIAFLAQRVLTGPISVLSQALGSTFWEFSARKVKESPRDLKNAYTKATKQTLLLSLLLIPAALFLIVVSKYMPDSAITSAFKLTPAFVPWAVGSIAFASFGHLIVLEKHHFQLFPDALRVALVTATILSCSYFGIPLFHCVLIASTMALISHITLYVMHLKAYSLISMDSANG